MNLNFGSLTAGAAQGLVNHDLGVWQRKTLSLGAGGQQERAHAGCHAGAKRRHIGLDEVHGVIDGHARADRATRRVDVEGDVLFRIFAFQKQQLSDHRIGCVVIDFTHQKDHALFEQARVNVIGAFAATRRFDDHGHIAQSLNVE